MCANVSDHEAAIWKRTGVVLVEVDSRTELGPRTRPEAHVFLQTDAVSVPEPLVLSGDGSTQAGCTSRYVQAARCRGRLKRLPDSIALGPQLGQLLQPEQRLNDLAGPPVLRASGSL